MLSEYSRYIQTLRNGLIQNGVEFSEGVDIDLSDYVNLFKLGNKIDDILLYFRLLAVGGDEDALKGFPINLGDTNRDRLNALFRDEFVHSVLPDYLSLTGIDEVGTLKTQRISVPNSGVSHGVFLDDSRESYVDTFNNFVRDTSPHGVMLDNEEIDTPHGVFSSISRVAHGVMLDELNDEVESPWGEDEELENDIEAQEDSDWSDDEESPWGDDDAEEASTWGVDEDEEASWNNDDGEKEETPWGDNEEDETPWGEDDEKTPWGEDEDEETESPWVDDESEETPWGEDEDSEETPWVDDEEESPWGENEDEDEGAGWGEDEEDDGSGWGDEEDEASGWGEEEETPWNDDDEDDSSGWGEEEVQVVNEQNPRGIATPLVQSPQGEKDLGDVFQTTVNNLLTRAKGSIRGFLDRKD